MASFDTLQALAQHPDWIAPRSDVRVFLGEPGAPEATKTTVEPGNAFSPGMRTFGLTWWLRFPNSGEFFATEETPLEALHWRYEEGHLPLLHCDTATNGLEVQHSLFQDGTAADRSEAVCFRLVIKNISQQAVSLQVFIALRSLGPAGGPLYGLKAGTDGHSLWLVRRDLPLLGVDLMPDALGCGVGDPSPLARTGIVPEDRSTCDAEGWCFGLMCFNLTLAPGQAWQIHGDCPQQSYGSLSAELPGTATPRPDQFDQRAQRLTADWRRRLDRIDLEVPDDNFRNAFFAGLQHILTATAGDQSRIAALSYPLPWLRDSAFIIRCFDLAGLHETARETTEYCVRNDFFGGFSAEGDAPGEGIWALVQHYRITRDRAWLTRVYPSIQRKCDWLFRMRRTTQPIQITADTPVLPFMHSQRNAGVICIAAQDGLILGVMDHGVDYAIGWVNHWALCGLREAAYAAHELGQHEDAERFENEASALRAALRNHAAHHPEFFTHERTVNSLLWPTRAWADDLSAIRPKFDAWWQTNRISNGEFTPEPYWLYFESAQAHNALLLGEPGIAWQVLQNRLQHQDLPGLYGWREGGDGIGTENAVYGVTLINQLRGCHRFDSITPHGWSQAEMWLLQRAMLIEEWQDGLLLFAGVPRAWLQPNARIAFRDFPTWYGKVNAALEVDTDGREARVTASGITPGTPVRIGHADQAVPIITGETGVAHTIYRISS